MMNHLNAIFRIIVPVLCGAVAMFTWFTWIEWESEREYPVRSSNMVLVEVEQARAKLRTDGVYWFTGSHEDADQLDGIVGLLEPSLRPFILRIEGFDGFVIISAQHPDFDNGWMSIRNTEEVLRRQIPSR